MSNSYEHWFFPWLERRDVERVKEEVMEFLLREGLIVEYTTAPEFRCGENYVLTEKFWGESDSNKPTMSHHHNLEIYTKGFFGAELNEIEEIVCPKCAAAIELSEWEDLDRLINAVIYSDEYGAYVCASCNATCDIRLLQSEPPLTFGRLAFKIDGCPDYAAQIYPGRKHLPAQFETARNKIESIAGSELRISEYRL